MLNGQRAAMVPRMEAQMATHAWLVKYSWQAPKGERHTRVITIAENAAEARRQVQRSERSTEIAIMEVWPIDPGEVWFLDETEL